MPLEGATLLVAIIAAAAGVVAALASIIALRYARKQDRQYPKLTVSEVCVLDPNESEAIREWQAIGDRSSVDRVVRAEAKFYSFRNNRTLLPR